MVQTRQTAIGSEDASFLFVLTHQPSPGMWAWFLQALLDCGIDSADSRFVFLLDEPPAGANGDILKTQMRGAWDRFAREIRASSPRVVVPLGSKALYPLTGISEHIFDARGYVITRQFFRPVVHDAFVQIALYKRASKVTGAQAGDPRMAWREVSDEPLLGMDFEGVVVPMFELDHISGTGFSVSTAVNQDLLRAARAARGELSVIDREFTFEKSLTLELAAHHWGPVVAVDIETQGIDNESIICVSVSDGEVSATLKWSIPVREFISKIFLDALNANRIVALHNSPFDLPRLVRNGVRIPQVVMDHHIFDTMFGGVIVQPDLLKGLGAMATIYLDVYPWKWELLSRADPDFYSAKDAFVTARLATALIKTQKDLGMWNLFMGKPPHPGPGVMATIPTLTRSSREGVLVDRSAAQVWCNRLERHLLRLLKMWNKKFPGYDPMGRTDLKRLFYQEWGLPLQKTRKDGISTDELACMRLREYTRSFATMDMAADEGWRKDPRFHPRVFDLLLAIRETAHNIGTYAQPPAQSMETRVHPQYLPETKDRDHRNAWRQGNTATGRLVAFRPNIQNQPKRARWLYVPDSPDLCFVQADYTRAEPYVMAYSARDANMIADLQSGDLYQRLLERLADLGYKGLKRKTCKNVFLAGQYLAGAPKVSEMILKQDHVFIDVETCRDILRGIAEVYSDVAAYKKWLAMQVEEKGYVRNAFGRVRFLHDRSAPAAVDFIPQSTVADILWCVLKDVDDAARRLGGRFILTVHDSILVAVPVAAVRQMVERMNAIMTRTFDCVAPGFHIPVEFEVAEPGVAWGGVKPYALAA